MTVDNNIVPQDAYEAHLDCGSALAGLLSRRCTLDPSIIAIRILSIHFE